MSGEPEWMSAFRAQMAWVDRVAEVSNAYADLGRISQSIPDFEITRAADEYLRELQNTVETFQKQMSAALVVAPALSELFKNQAFGIAETFRQIDEQTRAALSEAFKAPDWSALIDWEAMSRDLARGARELALRGWFVPLNSPAHLHLDFLELIEEGRWDECERQLETYYEGQLPTIRSDLLNQFPERKTFLERAFERHEEADFVSAIPLFLIQSDGIGRSILGGLSPLSTRDHDKLEKWVDQRLKDPDWFEGFWRNIHQVLPITANTNKLGGYLSPLNRHAVLHGIDQTYPSKRNSLKAIAWLQYVASFASLEEEVLEPTDESSAAN
jgi:hypothetical protein